VARFCRQAVLAVGSTSAERAKSLLFACAKVGAFAQSVGLELTFETVLCPSVIERCIVTSTSLSEPTRATLRSNLRYVGDRVVPGRSPAPVALSRQRAKAPYSPAEIDAYLALAAHQPTLSRRRRATGLLCLGAGAGLTGADLREVRGSSVTRRFGAVVVEVTAGRHPRSVPVLARYGDTLFEVAQASGDGFVAGGTDARRRNVTDSLVASLHAPGAGLDRLEVARLRSSWLASVAENIGLRSFLDAAGITCSQRLGDIVAGCEPLEEQRAIALLGAMA
jgi:hypothetical protein